jgi:hypothetical protein
VGGGEGYELASGDDFGLFPEWGEVAGVAGDQVVGAGGVGTFEEDVVGVVGGGGDAARKRGAEKQEGKRERGVRS